jgi:hypothetical protein
MASDHKPDIDARAAQRPFEDRLDLAVVQWGRPVPVSG